MSPWHVTNQHCPLRYRATDQPIRYACGLKTARVCMAGAFCVWLVGFKNKTTPMMWDYDLSLNNYNQKNPCALCIEIAMSKSNIILDRSFGQWASLDKGFCQVKCPQQYQKANSFPYFSRYTADVSSPMWLPVLWYCSIARVGVCGIQGVWCLLGVCRFKSQRLIIRSLNKGPIPWILLLKM